MFKLYIIFRADFAERMIADKTFIDIIKHVFFCNKADILKIYCKIIYFGKYFVSLPV